MNNSFNHRQKTILIGITAIVTLLIFYFGFNYLKGIHVFSKSVTYYATFDNVQGLDRSTKVFVNGYRVGNVRKIDFDYRGFNGAVVELALNSSLKIPRGSKLLIKNNPLGGGSITLLLPEEINDYLSKNDTIRGEQSTDMMAKLTEELIPNLNAAILSLDTLVGSVGGLVNNPDIPKTLAQLNATTSALQGSSMKLNHMMDHQVPAILGNVERSTQSIQDVAGQVAGADFEKTLADFTQVVTDLRKLSGQLAKEDSSLGLLLNDKGLYQKLDAAVHSADSLLKDIQKNPKRYVSFSVF
ncbi:MAG: MlaD family protein [Bacteroidales bacterium]|uniref:MlaD family protein n=1 Tax=Porphyromonas sp. TaxID=1924944 RepID=UPI00297AFB72|nr:MlaD family protein [Porphyromonas sp.]MDD7438656.1 MlaD family protein [Bacteroidales bacterium]MDY3067912.1 MlaD family protein [Porphyromonas sp.]